MSNKKSHKLKKIFLIIIFISFILFLIGSFFIIKIATTEKVNFDKDKLILSTSNINITDKNNKALPSISPYGKPIISIKKLNKHTINAFISIEDKNFYSHKGVNIKRMAKAMFTNLKNGYAKEGASTISQQTIKNSHLTNEKTLERKIKEIFLTLQLEHTFEKDEIMEIYLNIIYFGNNCFGIEQASQTYFGISASKLSLSQSAVLAGVIKSPYYYSPIKNLGNAIKRRNLVLNEMLKDGFITQEEYENAKEEKLQIQNNYLSKLNSTLYERLAINEACQKLKINEKDLVKSNYTIQTFFDAKMQNIIDKSFDSHVQLYKNNDRLVENNIIINDIKSGGIVAIKNNSDLDIFTSKRQPASTIKPILVYAPALEYGIISPDTILKDEKISINGYSPQNSYNDYLGNISSSTALAKSSNTCSVNLLNCLGIEKAKNYAKNLGIEFSKNDNHLGLSLGAMEYGTSLAKLSGAYSTFANGGKLTNLSIIKKITDDSGNILYEHTNPYRNVMTPETSFLITKMLQQSSIIGTNKRFNDLKFIPASKTGTNGASNSNKNIDAYNISYDTNYCINIWCGNSTGDETLNLGNEYAGGNYNAILSKDVWNEIYKNEKIIQDFKMPKNIELLDIDSIEYNENHKIMLASSHTPERYIKKCYFNKKYAPTEISQNFLAPEPPHISYKIIDDNIEIEFNTLPYLEYTIFKATENEIVKLQSFHNESKTISYQTPKSCDEITEYYVVCEYKNFDKNEIIKSPKSNIIKIYPNN